MSKIIISNLYFTSEENLLTDISFREMKSVEGGYGYGYGDVYGTQNTSRVSNTTSTTTASEAVTNTLGSVNNILGNLSSQIDQTMLSLRSQFQQSGLF